MGTPQTSSAALTVTLGSWPAAPAAPDPDRAGLHRQRQHHQRGGADQHHPDPTPGNNTSTTVTSRIDSADLRITKTASVSAGTVGQTFSYVITFDNAGPSAAANVTLTDALVGLTLVSATNSVGTLQTSSAAPDRDPGQRPAAPAAPDPDRAGLHRQRQHHQRGGADQHHPDPTPATTPAPR